MTTRHSKEELEFYGIYKIVNTITNDFYIGSTITSFKTRKSGHTSAIKHLHLNCLILYNAVLKYGIINFEFIIVKSFKNKKDSLTTKRIIACLEEKYINVLNPKYNICKKPTKGGCPNLNRKFSQEWKNKIGEKSKLYKHTGEIYIKVKKQNKEGSSLYRINNEFIGSLIDCANHYNVSTITILKHCKKKVKSKTILKVEKIKSQRKKVLLHLEKEDKLFNSYSECDKFLQMWRGYTSTQIVNNKSVILKYKYTLINEDIV